MPPPPGLAQGDIEQPGMADGNIWPRIRRQLALSRHLDHPSVKAKLRWYAKKQDYLDRVAERARPYLFYIVEEIEKRGLPLELALLPVVESAFHPFAYSPSHASGIWQFIPGTGKMYGLKQNWWYDGRRDIVAATQAALDYLEKLNKAFNGDWLLALAAYNTGERNVARAIKRNQRNGKKTDFFSLRLPRETRGYVPSLLAVAELAANPDQYNIHWTPIQNKPYFAQVNTGSQLDLAVAASLAGVTIHELYTLNPGFNRWATAPDGPHRLLVPLANASLLKQGLGKLNEKDRINWRRYVIKKGETLENIAYRYHTSVTALKKINRLPSDLIRESHSLLIPTAKKPGGYYALSLDNRRFRGLKSAGDGERYIYTIRSGDTLWDIGRQYGVSVSQLTRWNGISSKRLLRPGQKLTLWVRERTKTPGATGKHQNFGQKSGKNLFYYTVKKGDSLWLISRKFNVTLKQLLSWNNISKNKFLQPGQRLIVYQNIAQSAPT